MPKAKSQKPDPRCASKTALREAERQLLEKQISVNKLASYFLAVEALFKKKKALIVTSAAPCNADP